MKRSAERDDSVENGKTRSSHFVAKTRSPANSAEARSSDAIEHNHVRIALPDTLAVYPHLVQ